MAVSVVDTDAILIREHLGGERDAFDVLYRRYFPRLVRLCTRLTKDAAAAEDIAQETLVRAHQHLERFDQARPMWPWLKTIATRVLIDHVRAKSREVPTDADPVEEGQVDHGWTEEREVLAKALSKLPPRQRTAVALRYLEDWDGPQVAEYLGLSGLAFRQILHRAKRKLQSEYRRIAEPVMGLILLPAGWLRRTAHETAAKIRQLTSAPEAIKALAAAAAVNLAVATAAVFGGAGHGAPPSVAKSAPPNQSPAGAGDAEPVVRGRGSKEGPARGNTSITTASAVTPEPIATSDEEGLAGKAGDRGHDVAQNVTEPNANVSQPEDAQVHSVAYSPRFADDGTVYASGRAACPAPQCPPVLFRSSDAGSTWVRLEAAGLDGTQLLLPPAYGSGDDRIFAMGPVGLEVSEDGGASFHQAAAVTPAVGIGSSAISPAFNSGDPTILIGDHSLMQYRDDVKTVGPAYPIPGRGPLHPAFSPNYRNDGLILVGGLQVGAGGWSPSVFRCTDDVCIGSPFPFYTSETPKVRPASDFAQTNVAYAFTARHLLVSADAGQSFSEVIRPAGRDINDVAPAANGSLLTAVKGQAPDIADDVYSSPDGGRTWSLVESPTLSGGVRSLAVSGRNVLATLDLGGIACSADGGVTWASRCPVA
ncbi:MAG: sigma-70 family RNA polymerase sigma factor [Actinomycetota bacterium]